MCTIYDRDGSNAAECAFLDLTSRLPNKKYICFRFNNASRSHTIVSMQYSRTQSMLYEIKHFGPHAASYFVAFYIRLTSPTRMSSICRHVFFWIEYQMNFF